MVSGIRESEQPIQRICGDWPEARRGKRSGECVAVAWAHCLFWCRASLKASGREERGWWLAVLCCGGLGWVGGGGDGGVTFLG